MWEKIKKEEHKPTEVVYQREVDWWFNHHGKPMHTGRKREGWEGWTNAELELDDELSDAFDAIEAMLWQSRPYKVIQNATVPGLTRKDIIALAAFHPTKMKEVHHLIMHNRWDVTRAFKFINTTPGPDTTIHELQNHCLSTNGLYYACSVEGFDLQSKACKALASKIKE